MSTNDTPTPPAPIAEAASTPEAAEKLVGQFNTPPAPALPQEVREAIAAEVLRSPLDGEYCARLVDNLCAALASHWRACHWPRPAAVTAPRIEDNPIHRYVTDPRNDGSYELHLGPEETRKLWDEIDRLVTKPVFCASLADWLDDEVPIEWLAALLDLIRCTPNLDWLLLTKRPQNWRDRMMRVVDEINGNAELVDWVYRWTGQRASVALTEVPPVPPANVWLGTSVEDQTRAAERIPELLRIPARVRFLSCEPLLGLVTLTTIINDGIGRDALRVNDASMGEPERHVDWVICGGESGPGARPMHPDWARSLRDQCQDAGVAFFMKQMGGMRKPFPEIPADLLVRQFPEVRYA